MTRLTDISFAFAALVASAVALSGLLSPVTARAAEQATSVLTSQRPWLAPVGHRQPRTIDVPRDEGVAAREREQLLRDRVIDRSLVICRC